MIGFVVALNSESPNLLKKITNIHTSVVNGYEVYVLKFLESYACLIFSGVGKVNAAMATQTLIDHFKVTHIINVGSCGGLISNINVGDIIIPNLVSYYDVDVTAFGYKQNQIPRQPADFPTDKKLNETLTNILKLYPNTIMHGKIITGETFINKDSIKRFKFDEKSIGVDMEGAAIVHACSHNKIPCAIIKVVSDSIFHAEKNEKNWQKNINDIGQTIDRIISDVAYFLIYNKHK